MKNGEGEVWYPKQWTGWYDNQGNRVCEGDIICVTNLHMEADVRYILVEWDFKRVGWNIGYWKEKPMHIYHKVGNKYDKPELLDELNIGGR